jgi:GNAT superfamily N-acetyltransferase
MSVRLAVPADAAFLPAIERSAGEVFRTLPELAWIADHDVMSVEQHLSFIREGTCWVAVDGQGRITGFLSAERCTDAIHIWELSVDRAYQRQGIGDALKYTVESYARDEGLGAITLTTFRDVPWNEAYYQRLGYNTLPPTELDQRLAQILKDEVAHGLPGDRRCAMRKQLGAR